MANNILEMALEQLDFPPSTISAWFDDVTVVSFGDNRLVLHSPVPFKKEFIESKFIAPLQEVLHNLTGDPITIVVVTGEYTAPSTSTSPYDDYTFERFIVGSSNKFAHAAALAVSQRPAAENNPLFIYGNSGLGKTHLMYAIANVLRRTHPEYRIIYVKGEDFTNELITAIQEGNVQAFRNKYRMVDLLLLDDVLSELDHRRQAFVLNRIQGGQVFISCCEEEKLEGLENGKSFHIQGGRLGSGA